MAGTQEPDAYTLVYGNMVNSIRTGVSKVSGKRQVP